MTALTTCLWFDGRGEEAVEFYTSIFPNSKVLERSYSGEAGPGPKGTLLTATFELDGRRFMALNGGPQYTFTPAISFVVNCRTQEEIDSCWRKLTSGGGKEVQCGWLTDRFGVSWQVVPESLGKLMGGSDPARSQRVMQALLGMVKLDIAGLQRAYDGA